jgi:hypothetical protein
MNNRARALLGALSMAILACQDPIEAQTCVDIPDGGCPGVDNTNCLDITCGAIYTCEINGTWSEVLTCPVREAGPSEPTDTAPPSEAGSAPRDATVIDVNVPGANGGPGCVDLEDPDCSLGEALACGPGCCGCGDIFVCQAGGWQLWGECIDGGVAPVDGG